MLKALLLDLDDTLLGNSMATFVPAYFEALTDFASATVAPDRLIAELLRATVAMEANDGTGETNEEAFAAVFYPRLGLPRSELEPLLERFYADEFPRLAHLTTRRPQARPLVEWALARQLDVVIATNPLFPRTAIEQRLAWAGLPVTELPFALVTCYEDMHATKAHPSYYAEIVSRLGVAPGLCLMAGDNWEWDVVNAGAAGVASFWVAEPHRPPPDPDVAVAGHGDLDDLWRHLRAACGEDPGT